MRELRDGRQVRFDGSYGLSFDMVAKWWLKASQETLAPAGIVAADVALLLSARVFRGGDALRVDLQGRWFSPRNPFSGEFPAGYERSRRGSCVSRAAAPSTRTC